MTQLENIMQFSEETIDRAKRLFPTNYELHDYIKYNDKVALDVIREMDIQPHIHVDMILLALDVEDDDTLMWNVRSLRNNAQRISDIVALEELMLDELGIMEINN